MRTILTNDQPWKLTKTFKETSLFLVVLILSLIFIFSAVRSIFMEKEKKEEKGFILDSVTDGRLDQSKLK